MRDFVPLAFFDNTVCPKSLDQIYIVTYYIYEMGLLGQTVLYGQEVLSILYVQEVVTYLTCKVPYERRHYFFARR